MSSLTVTGILGFVDDPDLRNQIHHYMHDGKVEYLVLEREDLKRHRLRATTDCGTVCQIALPRSQHLVNGAILDLEPQRAIVVRMQEEIWIRCRAENAAAALELGYFAGNLHWRVRFEDDCLLIAQEGPRQGYIERLQPFLDDERVFEVA